MLYFLHLRGDFLRKRFVSYILCATFIATFLFNNIIFASTNYNNTKDIVGDINSDKVINNKDLGLFMQYLNNWDVNINLSVADVNDDGNVNNKDYGFLMQYVNNWDVILGGDPNYNKDPNDKDDIELPPIWKT